MPNEAVVRDETRHGDYRPAGAAIELLVHLIEIGNAGTREVEHVEAPLERLDGAAVEQGLLAGEECVPHPMILRRQLVPALGHRPVLRRAGRGRQRSEGAVHFSLMTVFLHRGFLPAPRKNPAWRTGRGWKSA